MCIMMHRSMHKKGCVLRKLEGSPVYTCQVSRLRRQSHACGLKTSISRRLTLAGQFLMPDWKMWVVAILLDTISKNMLINSWDACKERKPSVKWSEKQVKTSPLADFGRLRKTSDFFRKLQKWSCRLQKSQHSQDKNLTLISQKKLAGIPVQCY